VNRSTAAAAAADRPALTEMFSAFADLGDRPHLDAVVPRGWHSIVAETLADGLPRSCARPATIVAGQVVATGAAERVRFGRVRPTDLSAGAPRGARQPEMPPGRTCASKRPSRPPAAPPPHIWRK
jgi:hypothetical protein